MPSPTSAVKIHALTPSHVPAALRLSTDAGWNQREEDWCAAVELTPGASFGATADDVLVGTCIGINYGTFSWIAMMLVDPAFRRQGLGARLLLCAIDALPPDQPVGLDATAVGRLLYEQHGFRETSTLTRWIGEEVRFQPVGNDAALSEIELAIRRIESADSAAIASVDRHIFGGDRRRVLERAFTAGAEYCAIATVNNELAGYVFGRQGRVFAHLGTVVARSEPVAQALVRHVAKSARRPIGIDAFDVHTGWTSWLAMSGFAPQRPLARMIRMPRTPGSERLKVPGFQSSRVAGVQIEESNTRDDFCAFSIFGPEFA